MHRTFGRPLALAAGALLGFAACNRPPPPPPPAMPVAPAAADTAREAARDKDLQAAAVDAYVYGYPLVTMELTRRVMTNVTRPEAGRLAPMGQVAKLRAFPTPADRQVTAPSTDLLDTLAWLDVGAEPWIIGVPDMKGRYFLLPLLSAWTEVFEAPGSRTTGTRAQTYAVTGPGWTGKLPAGVKQLRSPTALVWMRGGISSTGGKADLAQVHALQDKLTVQPLSSWRKRYLAPAGRLDPAVDMKVPVREQVHAMDAVAYFKLLAALLKSNPPAPADTAAVAALGKIGLVIGQEFDGGLLDSVALRALAAAPRSAQVKILGQGEKAGARVNGWDLRVGGVGPSGGDHLQRAYGAAVGLGADRPQDAVNPVAEADADGKPFDGSRKYLLRFPKGKLPPAKAFWSLTVYDEQLLLAGNRLNRSTRGSRDKLKVNKDGSVDLYVQKDSPGKAREANWLPAPPGKFTLMLRLHWPHDKPPSVLDGSWKPPPVTQAR
jgi:hypothetical protein